MNKDDIKFVVDIETTGLDYKREKIIEIAAVKLINNQITETFESLVNPMQHIRNSSINIHGINEQMILEAPTIEEILPQFIDFIQDKPIIGHNVIFDYSFLNHASLSLFGKELSNKRIDTLTMFKEVFPEERSHGLASLLNRFKIHLETKHRALADAYGLAQAYPLLKSIYDERFSWQLSQLNNINYLFERYLRIQTLIQTLQAEMGDIKSVFKIYFDQGGDPIQSTSGELLTVTSKLNYQYDFDSAKLILEEFGMSDKILKLNTSVLDKMINSSYIEEEIKDKLNKTRVNISEQQTVIIQKPEKNNGN